eukprot:3321207-Amphidinium_carterae.1
MSETRVCYEKFNKMSYSATHSGKGGQNQRALWDGPPQQSQQLCKQYTARAVCTLQDQWTQFGSNIVGRCGDVYSGMSGEPRVKHPALQPG